MQTKFTESSINGRLPLSKSENMLEPKYKMKIVVYGHLLKHSRPPWDNIVVNILAWYKKILTFSSLHLPLISKRKRKESQYENEDRSKF
jgi:hypothetical protein